MLRAVIFAEGATNGKPRGERALEGMSRDSQVVSDHEESGGCVKDVGFYP